MILGFKLSFTVLFFIVQVVAKIQFFTLLVILGNLMLIRTNQLVSLSQSKLEIVGSSDFILSCAILTGWKIFSKKLDDVVIYLPNFCMILENSTVDAKFKTYVFKNSCSLNTHFYNL